MTKAVLVEGTSQPAAPHPATSNPAAIIAEVHSMIERNVYVLRVKEASGMPLVGVFVTAIVEKLDQAIPNHRLHTDMEFPVVLDTCKPRASVTVVITSGMIPIVL